MIKQSYKNYEGFVPKINEYLLTAVPQINLDRVSSSPAAGG
jgi:hypothetical protein